MSDRKYSHRGYQDRGDEPKGRGPSPDLRSRAEGAPRGRSIGTEATAVFKCGECGERVLTLEEITPDSACRKCGAALHSCSNCAHYDSSTHFECTEAIPERIPKKYDKNACTFWKGRVQLDLAGPKPATPGDARAAFDRLFRKI